MGRTAESSAKATMENEYGTAWIIKTILKNRGMTRKVLAKALGKEEKALNRILAYDRMSVSTICEMLTVLDYELIIQPRKRGRRPGGQYVVEKHRTAEIGSCEDVVNEPSKKPITLEAFQRRDY